ncbi:uncharacterized protein [Oryza sativa Japonica Group]|uniref:uncharacterized protein isoform X1 n=1 Tax=Oryza sativa subsp. japonica TaxID=39947 RepID=UPI0007754F18|nr:uncharacterized protein LOC4346635 isoform X1 [Oryza sativa Japonica Group]XP_015612639.1 uncharacterized protein LOC4346635 isoform X1 [Oryza sativa Japonica Group]
MRSGGGGRATRRGQGTGPRRAAPALPRSSCDAPPPRWDGPSDPAPPLAPSLTPNPNPAMAPLLPAPLLLPLVPHPREQEQQENAEEGEEQRPRPTPTTMEKKVVEPSKKKKFVDLKSMWGRAEKKLKSIVDSNNISEHSARRKDPEPATIHAPATKEIGCSRACEVGFAQTETQVPYESIEVSRPQDVDGSIEVSKPHVANSESEEEDDWLEDVDEDVGFLPHDPGKRIAISDYSVYQQDEVRMKYIALGPCRPPLEQFPQRNCGGKRRFIHSLFDKYSWLEYSEEKDAAFCFVCYLFKDRTNYVGGDSFVNEGFRQWNHHETNLAICNLIFVYWICYLNFALR